MNQRLQQGAWLKGLKWGPHGSCKAARGVQASGTADAVSGPTCTVSEKHPRHRSRLPEGKRAAESQRAKNIAMATLAVASTLKTLNPSPADHRGRRLSSSLLHLPPPVPRGRSLRCSAQYGEAAAPATTTTTPRPAEIAWSRELCNSVRLIGTVGTEVELRQLPSGSAVAKGRLAVWKSATETTWYSKFDWCYAILTYLPFLASPVSTIPCYWVALAASSTVSVGHPLAGMLCTYVA